MCCCCSVAVVSDSATPWTTAYQASLYFTISPKVCSNSCPPSWWCFLTILSFAALFSFCLRSFPASGSFPVNWLFVPDGQSIGASVSAADSPMNIQGWFPLGLTGLISLLSMGLSRVFSSATIWKHQFCGGQPSLWSNSHMDLTTGKTIALTVQTFVGKVMSAF